MALCVQVPRARSQPPPGQAMAPNCEYFVLSPRPSLGTPLRDGDENDPPEVNALDKMRIVKNIAGEFPKKGGNVVRRAPQTARPSSGGRKTLGSPRPLSYSQQPCMRPATPKKTRSPSECATPNIDDTEAWHNTSVHSEYTGRESRLARLARRSTTQRSRSTKELEQKQVEEKRREVQERIRKNEVNRRKALFPVEVSTASRVSRATKLATPRDGGLSAPPTPKPRTRESSLVGTPEASVRSASVFSEDDNLSLPQSLRKKPGQGFDTGRKHVTPAKQWKPQLTVPRAPELHTTGRRLSRSESRSRRPSSCPLEEDDTSVGRPASAERSTRATPKKTASPTRESTPEKRRLAVFAAAARLERHAAAAATATTTRVQAQRQAGSRTPVVGAAGAAVKGGAPRECTENQSHAFAASCSKTGSAAQERAQRARLAVHQKKEEEARLAKEKWCVFKKPASNAAAPRVTVHPPPSWEEGNVSGEMSVRSTRSTASDGVSAKRGGFGSTTQRPCLDR